MKWPKQLRVGPYRYTLRYDRQATSVGNVNGATMSDSLLILLTDILPADKERETVLHESLHALWDLLALDVEWPDDNTSDPGERIIMVLAPALLSLLRDNPKLAAYLLET